MRTDDTTWTTSPSLPPWLDALRGQLALGGNGAPPETLGPVTALTELGRVCDTMLAGRGGPNDDDRKSLVGDVLASRGALGPALVRAVGPVLETFISDLSPLLLATPQGARALKLSLGELRLRFQTAEAAQAAWDDVVAAFRDAETTAETCESRIRTLREICETRDHSWFGISGLARRLRALLSDQAAEAAAVGAIVPEMGSSPIDRAGLTEESRISWCRHAVSRPGMRGDVAVWLLFRNAHIPRWKRLGPVQLFNARLMPDAVRRGGGLERMEGFVPPAELDDWDEAAVLLGDVELAEDEHAVFARVWLTDVPVAQAPERARALLETVIEIANDRSQWELQAGEAAHRDGGSWYGSLGFVDPAQLERNAQLVSPVLERTATSLDAFEESFVTRLAADEEVAIEAVEEARWVIAVAGASTTAQRIALGTRALERTLGVAQAGRESWTDVTRRYLQAPWLEIELKRWVQDVAICTRLGTAKTHGRYEPLYDFVDAEVCPRVSPGIQEFSAAGIRRLEGLLGPLDTIIARGLAEHRIVREAIMTLREPKIASRWLSATEKRFDILLARLERSRNAVIHGQRPSPRTLETVDEFVRDLGRLVAQESMRSAETGDEPLVQLERWRMRRAEQQARLRVGDPPLDVLFG